MPVLSAVHVHLAVSVDNGLLLHTAVAAQWSVRGGGTTLELLAKCKQLLYVFLAVHSNLLLAASAVLLAASVKSRRLAACCLAMYCSANDEGTITLLATDAAPKAVMQNCTE